MTRRTILVVISCALAFAACSNNDKKADTAAAPTKFTFRLSGTDEAPTPGDPKATGSGSMTIAGSRPSQRLCFKLSVKGLDQVIASHLQQGDKGRPGPIIMPLPDLKDGKIDGCRPLDDTAVAAIQKAPSGYFVNVRTADFPGGAIRGQLKATKAK